MPGTIAANVTQTLEAVAALARESGDFAGVELGEGVLACAAKDAPEPAYYRLLVEDGVLYAEWASPDRYLSQSIEQELVYTGDDLWDMIDEELVDLGSELGKLGEMEHFRTEDKLFVFRTKVPVALSELDLKRHAEDLFRCLRAYEIVLSEMGDMQGGEDE